MKYLLLLKIWLLTFIATCQATIFKSDPLLNELDSKCLYLQSRKQWNFLPHSYSNINISYLNATKPTLVQIAYSKDYNANLYSFQTFKLGIGKRTQLSGNNTIQFTLTPRLNRINNNLQNATFQSEINPELTLADPIRNEFNSYSKLNLDYQIVHYFHSKNIQINSSFQSKNNFNNSSNWFFKQIAFISQFHLNFKEAFKLHPFIQLNRYNTIQQNTIGLDISPISQTPFSFGFAVSPKYDFQYRISTKIGPHSFTGIYEQGISKVRSSGKLHSFELFLKINFIKPKKEPTDSDKDGIIDKIDECPHVKGLPQFNGCPYMDSDSDSIPDHIDKCPFEKGTITNNGCLGENKELIKKNNQKAPTEIFKTAIHFQKDKYLITPKALDKIIELIDHIPENNPYTLIVFGHTDSDGSHSYNYALGRNRAIATRKLLTQLGIDNSNITVSSFGEIDPLKDNTNKANMAMNRRCEVTLILR